MDQSKAYNVVDHVILQRKMEHIRFNKKSLAILSRYMSQRKLYVEVDRFPSEQLVVGPQSVTQGSSLSCVLYIIMILDITSIYHESAHHSS